MGILKSRIFLLSPANCGGRRAQQLLSPQAEFPLALELRSGSGIALGAVFSFMSGLYFRGKLAYASRFASPPPATRVEPDLVGGGVHIITPTSGLRAPETRVTAAAIRSFASGDIDPANRSYRRPLERSARSLAEEIGDDCDVVLLGSIASPKYVEILLGIFGDRLHFPQDFVGRGDMSRGGLLLRKVTEGVELEYSRVAGAVVHGSRPPRLPPLRPSL